MRFEFWREKVGTPAPNGTDESGFSHFTTLFSQPENISSVAEDDFKVVLWYHQ